MIGYNENEGSHIYYVYIITNLYRSTYYIGITNNLVERLKQHQDNIEKGHKTFAAKYNLKHLVYYEQYSWVQNAIAREKELKAWRREKKLDLVRSFNADFEFLEDRFLKE
ncbi:GIY-YIG nuclease family protein [Psychroserpens mesophilus]|uniref:GIY-YIG nuclease family protein n=1 Tax=Psychroserpens mesophilus TaxID=325473 RepID=UPI003D653FA4